MNINLISDPHICLAEGFLASGVACGIKKDFKKDLAIVYATEAAVAAAVFTKNLVKGDSLLLSQKYITSDFHRALVINSGNANACVGEHGMQAAKLMSTAVAKALNLSPAEVLTASTGVIGVKLDQEKLSRGIVDAAQKLSSDDKSSKDAMHAIMTTDTVEKEAAVRVDTERGSYTIAAMAKGSGMIHPNMATLIGVLTTDVKITKSCLQEALVIANECSFNRISVDGDMSCCDMLVLMSSGLSSADEINSLDSAEGKAFVEALSLVCTTLAREVARDGEGATKLVTIQVNSARTTEDAYKIALAVAKSPLVKTAIYGADANWGRILTAAGYSGAHFDPLQTDIYIGSVLCYEKGVALPFDEEKATLEMQKDEVLLRIECNMGSFSDHYWTCDFTEGYIKINGDYRS